MSLPAERGDQQVRSCGLVRKQDNAGKVRFEVLGTCIIEMSPQLVTAESSTANGNEYTEATTASQ
jgi:hypothetical protein